MHSYNSLYIYLLLLKGTIHPFAPQKSMIKSFGREFRSVLRLKQVIYSACMAKLMKYVWIEKNNTGSFYCIPSTVFKLFLYEN